MSSICERFEIFAQTINKHLAFNGKWSKNKKRFQYDFWG